MEIDPGSSYSSEKTYIYANGKILMQHDGDMDTGAKYFYLHDRLGNSGGTYFGYSHVWKPDY